jgi:hypothetical protein
VAIALVILLVLFVLAPVTSYGGRYPSTWGAGYGWLPAIVIVLALVLLIAGGGGLGLR